MNLKRETLIIVIYIYIIFQTCLYVKLTNANSVGRLGYYNYNEANSYNEDIKVKSKNNFDSLKDNFIKLFMTDESESNLKRTDHNSSANTPFMDFFHTPLIKKVIPKSEEVCSSIQLMSFWKLYSDLIDLVESEFIGASYSNSINNTIHTKLHENKQALTQSMEISQEVSEELKITKSYASSSNKTSINKPENITEPSLRSQKSSTKINKKPNKTKNNRNKKKQNSQPNITSTFQFGFHKYFNIN